MNILMFRSLSLIAVQRQTAASSSSRPPRTGQQVFSTGFPKPMCPNPPSTSTHSPSLRALTGQVGWLVGGAGELPPPEGGGMVTGGLVMGGDITGGVGIGGTITGGIGGFLDGGSTFGLPPPWCGGCLGVGGFGRGILGLVGRWYGGERGGLLGTDAPMGGNDINMKIMKTKTMAVNLETMA